MRAKGFLDFSMDRLTERNKENSFLDVDWIIEELLALGQHRISVESPTLATSPTTDVSSTTTSASTEKVSSKTTTKLKSATETAKSVIGQKSNKRVVSVTYFNDVTTYFNDVTTFDTIAHTTLIDSSQKANSPNRGRHNSKKTV